MFFFFPKISTAIGCLHFFKKKIKSKKNVTFLNQKVLSADKKNSTIFFYCIRLSFFFIKNKGKNNIKNVIKNAVIFLRFIIFYKKGEYE